MEERLPNTKPRTYEECANSLKNWEKWEWKSKVKRLQQLGLSENWYLDRGISFFLEEAENCYVLNAYYASSFFAGVALELGMKIHARNWSPPKKKFKDFETMINTFARKGIINVNETDMAHKLRKIRNDYGHANINKLAKRAIEEGFKVRKTLFRISSEGSGEISGADEDIITDPKDYQMKLTFLHFNARKLAWKSLIYANTVLLKLFPLQDK